MPEYNLSQKIAKRLWMYKPGTYIHERRAMISEDEKIPKGTIIKAIVTRPLLDEERRGREQWLHVSLSKAAQFTFNVGGMTYNEMFDKHNFVVQLPESFNEWAALVEAQIDVITPRQLPAAACGTEE